jgi:hypothetical protein
LTVRQTLYFIQDNPERGLKVQNSELILKRQKETLTEAAIILSAYMHNCRNGNTNGTSTSTSAHAQVHFTELNKSICLSLYSSKTDI